jgi:acyl-CoA dehydrogenase
MATQSGAPFLEPAHDRLRARARSYSLKQLAALTAVAERNRDEATRRATRALGREGFLQLLTVKAYGGKAAKIDHRALVAVREGIAYASSVAHSAFAVQGLGMVPLTLEGSEEQRREWLPKAARGLVIGGYGLTEPGAGSDVAAMSTRAREEKGAWRLTGTKTYISNAGVADFYCVFGKTDPSLGHRGISCFLMPADTKGLKVKPLKMLANVPIGTLEMKGVKLPGDAVVGPVGSGFYTAMRTLDTLRPTVASAACGVAARALDEAVKRAKSRKAFGKTLAEHQGVRWKLAQAATDLEAARLLTYRAAWLKDRGQERITVEAAQAKLFATEAAWRIVDMAVQIHGASGLERDSVTAQMYREIRALRVYEGTSEVLQEVVGSRVLHGSSP